MRVGRKVFPSRSEKGAAPTRPPLGGAAGSPTPAFVFSKWGRAGEVAPAFAPPSSAFENAASLPITAAWKLPGG